MEAMFRCGWGRMLVTARQSEYLNAVANPRSSTGCRCQCRCGHWKHSASEWCGATVMFPAQGVVIAYGTAPAQQLPGATPAERKQCWHRMSPTTLDWTRSCVGVGSVAGQPLTAVNLPESCQKRRNSIGARQVSRPDWYGRAGTACTRLESVLPLSDVQAVQGPFQSCLLRPPRRCGTSGLRPAIPGNACAHGTG